MITSLKFRVTLAAALLLLLCLGLVAIAVSDAFTETLEKAAKEQLSANANLTLTAAARVNKHELVMPEQLADPWFNNPDSHILGYIYSSDGQLVWQSVSSQRYPPPDFDPKEKGLSNLMMHGINYLVYDSNVHFGRGTRYSFVTMVPAERYNRIAHEFRSNFFFWMGMLSWVLICACWLALWWALRPVREVSRQLNQVKSGEHFFLQGEYPLEISRLTDSINTLLKSEQQQKERYRNSMEDLAHSLKTPLVIVQSISQTLDLKQHTITSAEMDELRSSLNSQVKRLNSMVSYHLQRSMVSSKGLVRKQVLVRPIVDELSQTLTKVYWDKKVHFHCNDESSNSCFNGDEQDLLELLGNVMENAFKYCQHQVAVSICQPDNKELQIIIADDGSGIAPEHQRVIVQRGVRADCRTTGQGIGLAMVMEIIENYEGNIDIASSSLGGAKITISFPA